MSAVSQAQRLPFPAFPLRASLPPLAPASGPVQAATPGPVQAAAPPAEYNSDSAESLEEIPVVLAKLGSSSSAAARDTTTSLYRGGAGLPLPSPQPRTKRKAPLSRTNKSAAELRFEMASTHPPVVFVSRASGEDLTVGRRQAGSRLGSRPSSRASLGSAGTSRLEL